ncbi:hypothetical protein F4X90_19420, partial [Candidatus Poribacteria bacterium]|nr:hypothetical protein [Candidatus Poribacteria bacterium]
MMGTPLNFCYGRPAPHVRAAIEAGGGVILDDELPAAADWQPGIASVLEGGRHALIVDVDGAADWPRIADVAARHALPALHVWQTEHGYHLLSLCARDAREIDRMMRGMGCDPEHRRALLEQGYVVLRCRERWPGERRYLGVLAPS